MATLATLVVDLIAETAKFMEGMDKSISKMQAVEKSFKQTGDKLTGFGKGLTTKLTLPIIGAGAAMLKAGSDLEQSIGAVDTVFGEAAGAIHAFGQTSATTVGLSTRAFNQMSAQTGAMLQNMGYDSVAAADEMASLATRAADMAAVFDTDVSQAMEAIQAGLRGEIDPLEKFGVSLKASEVAAKAVEMGLADSASEMSNHAKAVASLAVVYEQTEKIAGAFQAEQDTFAVQFQILKSQAEDLAASFKGELLPPITQLIAWVRGLVTNLRTLNPEQRRTILLVAGIGAAIGPVIVILGTLISSIGTIIGAVSAAAGIFGSIAAVITGPVLLAIAAVVAAIVGLYLAWQNNFLGIQEKTQAVIQFLINIWHEVLLPALQVVGSMISNVIIPVLTGIADVLSAVVGLAVTALAGLWQNVLWPALQTVGNFLAAVLGPAFETVANIVKQVVTPALTWLNDNVIQPLITGFGGIIDAVQKVVNWLGTLAEKIRSIKLPDWLTPGSPTPFEMGLRGIADALNVINRTQLPRLESRLGNLALAPIQASVAGRVSGGGDTYNTFNFPNVRIDDERDLTRRIRTTQILMEA